MKKLALIALAILAFSCKKEHQESFGKPEITTEVQTPQELGKEIFNGKGACVACHQPDAKLIGPSLKDIAKIYQDKNGDMIKFFRGDADAIVDPEQFVLMQPNLEITKTFSDEELKALEAYIHSNLK